MGVSADDGGAEGRVDLTMMSRAESKTSNATNHPIIGSTAARGSAPGCVHGRLFGRLYGAMMNGLTVRRLRPA
jgi:hypothetical protein